jgi:D-glycero-D-manno-heptose 1,7-bisphosphate phosphatase
VREPIPAGTGGALLHIADQLDRWFVMANGDSIFDIDLRALAKLDPPGAGARNDFVGRLALREVPDTARYGAVELCDDRIVAFREKSSAKARRGVINGGVYLLNRDILSKLKMPCSIEMDVFPALAKAGRLRGVQFDGYFLDIGLPEMLERAKREIPQRLAPAASI